MTGRFRLVVVILCAVLLTRTDLSFSAPLAETVADLVSQLSAPDASVRDEAVKTLQGFYALTAATPIIGRLEDQAPEVRSSALLALKSMAYRPAISMMAQRLSDVDENVRFDAAMALAELNAVMELPALRQALAKETSSVTRRHLIEAITDIGGAEDASFLLDFLHDEDQAVRSDLIYCLPRIADRRHVPWLRPLLQDADNDLRESARNALLLLGDAGTNKELRLLRDCLHDRVQNTPAVNSSCPKPLVTEPAVITVRLAEREAESGARYRLDKLKDLGVDSDIPTLRQLLAGEDEYLSQATALRLGLLGAREVIPDLLPLLNSCNIQTRRAMALALLRLGSSEGLAEIRSQLRMNVTEWLDDLVTLGQVDEIYEALAEFGHADLFAFLADRHLVSEKGIALLEKTNDPGLWQYARFLRIVQATERKDPAKVEALLGELTRESNLERDAPVLVLAGWFKAEAAMASGTPAEALNALALLDRILPAIGTGSRKAYGWYFTEETILRRSQALSALGRQQEARQILADLWLGFAARDRGIDHGENRTMELNRFRLMETVARQWTEAWSGTATSQDGPR